MDLKERIKRFKEEQDLLISDILDQFTIEKCVDFCITSMDDLHIVKVEKDVLVDEDGFDYLIYDLSTEAIIEVYEEIFK